MIIRRPANVITGGLVFGLVASAAPSPASSEDSSVVNSPGLPVTGGQAPEDSGLITADTTAAVPGLTSEDVEYMREIGMAYQGENAFQQNKGPTAQIAVDDNETEEDRSSTTNIWIGHDGPNTFTFRNDASVPAILVLWESYEGDGQSSLMNVRRPKITYSLSSSKGSGSDKSTSDSDELRTDRYSQPWWKQRRTAGNVEEHSDSESDDDASITVSVAPGTSGGWSALYNHETELGRWGQVNETWGEFSTGSLPENSPSSPSLDAVVGVSYLVNSGGRDMSINVPETGCVSDATTCSLHCRNPAAGSCGEEGSYKLLRGCLPSAGSDELRDNGLGVDNHGATGASSAANSYAAFGTAYGAIPRGGCRGWDSGGHVEVTLGVE